MSAKHQSEQSGFRSLELFASDYKEAPVHQEPDVRWIHSTSLKTDPGFVYYEGVKQASGLLLEYRAGVKPIGVSVDCRFSWRRADYGSYIQQSSSAPLEEWDVKTTVFEPQPSFSFLTGVDATPRTGRDLVALLDQWLGEDEGDDLSVIIDDINSFRTVRKI